MIRSKSYIRGRMTFLPGLPLVLCLIAATLFLHPDAFGKNVQMQAFSSPEEGFAALVSALKTRDEKSLFSMYGKGNEDLISSGDDIEDRAEQGRFLRAYDERNRIEKIGNRKALLCVSNEGWSFPVPMVRKGKVWFFDVKAGRREMTDRRIGRNELNVIQVCLAYVDAQREYALKDRKGNRLFEYARKFVSDPGTKDGLYWDTKEGEEPSPLGALAVAARAQGSPAKSRDKPVPYHGYYYRILTAQGEKAGGGAYNYVVDGRMIGGFALVAYPARFGVTGIMTFTVNHRGVVYQKNLGRNTDKVAGRMETFNPDRTWKRAEEPPSGTTAK